MMVGEIITNFELYVWIALGLFVVGILAVLVYDNGTPDSKLKRGNNNTSLKHLLKVIDRRI